MRPKVDRLDGDDPPRRRSGQAAVRAPGRRLPAAGPRRARHLLRAAARPARGAGRQAGPALPRRLRARAAAASRCSIRVYVAQLRAARKLLERQHGEAADPWMTLVGYFNSLRELGGMRRLVDDDVPEPPVPRASGEGSRPASIIEELTSRKSATDIPEMLDQLGVRRLSQDEAQAAPRRRLRGAADRRAAGDEHDLGRRRRAAPRRDGRRRPAEDAPPSTSRRRAASAAQHPGLVLTVYNWARPRDLSHYETFEHYHARSTGTSRRSR